MNCLISIIVPIYKVEGFLPACIESILSSKSLEFELVLVDDGSPDSCPEICDAYGAKDSRIRVIHKANGGVSDARNAGIQEAKGEYLLFVDGDDGVEIGSIDRILEKLKTEGGSDLIFLHSSWVHENGSKMKNPYEYPFDRDHLFRQSKEEAFSYLEGLARYINPSPWGKLVRRDLMVEYEISFVKGIVAEDFALLLELVAVATSFDVYDFPYYIYRTGRADSYSSTQSGRRGMFHGLIYSFEKWFEVARKGKDGKEALIRTLLAEQCGLLLLYNQSLGKKERRENKKKIGKYLSLMKYSGKPKMRLIYLSYKVLGLGFVMAMIALYAQLDGARNFLWRVLTGKKGTKTRNSTRHICFFSGDITRGGGTEHVCLEVASLLAEEEKYRVSVVSLMEAAQKSYYEFPKGIGRHVLLRKPTEPIIKSIYKFFAIECRLIQLIRREKIDILIDVDGILDVFSLPARSFTGAKVITWEHFSYYNSLGNPLRILQKKISARCSDHLVVLSKEDKGYFQKNMKIKAPIDYIYNPMKIREGVVYNRDSKRILSVGRLVPEKGFDLLIEVANKVLEKHKDWIWVIAGEGNERPKLEAKIREYGLESQLQLWGNVKDMDSLYGSCALFVLTSRTEAFPLVMMEAKGHLLPVVSFACKAGPREMVKDGVNGYLVKCFDVETMAQRIDALIENQESRLDFSAHAVDGMEKLNPDQVTEKWEKIINV